MLPSRSSTLRVLLLETYPFNMPLTQKSHRFRNGERGGHVALLIVAKNTQ
jgi:hypothetical protein